MSSKYDKAVECLIKDCDALLAFYDFPAEHWKHLRTTNVIESAFATVRHRTVRSKGCLSNKTALGLGFLASEIAVPDDFDGMGQARLYPILLNDTPSRSHSMVPGGWR